MIGPAEILRELHRLHRFAADLQEQIERGPRLLKAQNARVAKQEETLHQAQDSLKRLKVKTHEQEGELKSVLAQIKKHEKQLNEAGGKKEYDALQLEIANAKKEVQKLEDQILEGMTETDDRIVQLPEIDRALQKIKEEAAQFERDYEARKVGLKEQFDQTMKVVKETEAKLPAEVMIQYNRLINIRGADGLCPVVDRTCKACYTGITPQQYNDLLQEMFVPCRSCGRILYLPE